MESLNRNLSPIRMRNYGRIIQQMIAVASEEEDIQIRQRMTVYIARCMRQKNLIWNKDQESGLQRIKDDILTLSNGVLSTSFEGFEQAVQQRIAPRPEQFVASKKKKNRG